MLDVNMCRLCLKKDDLIDVFYSHRPCKGTNHLRTCILLCTGINILPEDEITKYVCRKCCDLSLGLFQFRQTALANDRVLKHLDQYVSSNLPIAVDEIVELNELLIKNRDLTLRRYDRDELKNTLESEENNYAVHPSVMNIIKTYKNIVMPKEALKWNLNPAVVLDSDWENFSDDSQSDGEDSNEVHSNFPATEADDSDVQPHPDETSMDLLEVVKEQPVITKPPQTKKRKLVRKRGNQHKRPKRQLMTIPMLKNKFLSLQLCDIADNSDKNASTLEALFFQPNELNFLEDLFERYKRLEVPLQNNPKQTVSIGVNTENTVPTSLHHSIETINGAYIISASSECLNYRIPVVCEYNEGITKLKIVANNKDVEPVAVDLWDVDEVIDINNRTEQC